MSVNFEISLDLYKFFSYDLQNNMSDIMIFQDEAQFLVVVFFKAIFI